MQDIEKYLDDYLKGKLTGIDELETKSMPVGYALHGASKDAPEYNRYEKFVTTSMLSW